MDDDAIETWHARVTGRVQGVGFRAACQRQAEALGLAGWVRNRRDGAVEAMLQGPPAQLARMREWLRQGPPMAIVGDLSVSQALPDAGRFEGFELRRTE